MILLEDIKKIYNKGKQNEYAALRGVTIAIDEGEMIAIVGKSGAGKSTLMHIMGCIDDYDEGKYFFDGRLVKDLKDKELAKIRNKEIGIIMQDYALVENLTALDNVRLIPDFGGIRRIESIRMSINALKMVDMENYMDKLASELSGGQKQRVAIARAIVNNPKVILADEPTGALDTVNTDNVIKILTKLNTQGLAVILITHDQYVAAACKRQVVLTDGKIEYDSSVDEKGGLHICTE